MSKMNIGILSVEEVSWLHKIEEKYGLKSKTTAFANPNNGQYKGFASVDVDVSYEENVIIKPDGSYEKAVPGDNDIGIRLGINNEYLYMIPWENGKTLETGEVQVQEGEYGVYPKEPAPYADKDKMIPSGKEYTIVEDGQLVVKKEYLDYNGDRYVEKYGLLYKVAPIKWIIVISKNVHYAITRDELAGGLPFAQNYYYEIPGFKKAGVARDDNPNRIENYINNCLVPDIFPEALLASINKEIEEKEKQKRREKQKKEESTGYVKEAAEYIYNITPIKFKMPAFQIEFAKQWQGKRTDLLEKLPKDLSEEQQIYELAKILSYDSLALSEAEVVSIIRQGDLEDYSIYNAVKRAWHYLVTNPTEETEQKYRLYYLSMMPEGYEKLPFEEQIKILAELVSRRDLSMNQVKIIMDKYRFVDYAQLETRNQGNIETKREKAFKRREDEECVYEAIEFIYGIIPKKHENERLQEEYERKWKAQREEYLSYYRNSPTLKKDMTEEDMIFDLANRINIKKTKESFPLLSGYELAGKQIENQIKLSEDEVIDIIRHGYYSGYSLFNVVGFAWSILRDTNNVSPEIVEENLSGMPEGYEKIPFEEQVKILAELVCNRELNIDDVKKIMSECGYTDTFDLESRLTNDGGSPRR